MNSNPNARVRMRLRRRAMLTHTSAALILVREQESTNFTAQFIGKHLHDLFTSWEQILVCHRKELLWRGICTWYCSLYHLFVKNVEKSDSSECRAPSTNQGAAQYGLVETVVLVVVMMIKLTYSEYPGICMNIYHRTNTCIPSLLGPNCYISFVDCLIYL